VVVWVLAVIALAVEYPALRGPTLSRAYAATELGSLLVGVGCFLSWLPRRREQPPGMHTTVATLLVAVGLAGLVVGPWRFGIFTRWSSAQITYAATYAVIFALEGGFLWITPRSLPPSSPPSR